MSLSPEQLPLYRRLWDSMPAQPILYKPHPEWVVVAQCCKKILHHHSAKIVEMYNKYSHSLTPLQAGDTSYPKPTQSQQKSSRPYQINNTESELMNQDDHT